MSIAFMIGTSTGTVQRMSSSKDAAGGIVQNWGTIYSDVPMRDEITGSRIEEIAGQKKIIRNHRIYTQQSGITLGMRIIFDGAYLTVIGDSDRRERSPAIPTWYEIDCEEHQGMPAT